MKLLSNPWVDRSIAVAATAPFVYPLVIYFGTRSFSIPELAYMIQFGVLAATMSFRRPPTATSSNPLFWLLAFAVTYGGFFKFFLVDAGRAVIPLGVADAISIMSLAGSVWARTSLGRNIGFVPARRGVTTGGAYRYVRHPIYASVCLAILGDALTKFSLRNYAVLGAQLALIGLKSLADESFMKTDPEYSAYLKKVPWRWIPRVL